MEMSSEFPFYVPVAADIVRVFLGNHLPKFDAPEASHRQ
jgi:hypothetical protein